jgi:plasmid stabilization system protein ParE
MLLLRGFSIIPIRQKRRKSDVRRVYIRRFRYSMFYTVDGDEIVILHVRHAARRWPWEDEAQENR